MADKPPDTKPKKKYLDKFDDDEQLAKAYSELERKLSEQGSELGMSRQQITEAQQALQQYAQQVGQASQWIQQYAPIVQWFRDNHQEIQRRFAAPAETPAPANGQDYELLTHRERERIIGDVQRQMLEQFLNPWTRQFEQSAQRLAAEVRENLAKQVEAQQRSFAEVMWQTMKYTTPEDQIKKAQDWHAKALEYASADKFNPMQAAQDYIKQRAEFDTLQRDKEELTKRLEQAEKAHLPPAFTGGTPATWGTSQPSDDAPKSREERFVKVMDSTKEAVGTEAMRDFFPTGPGTFR